MNKTILFLFFVFNSILFTQKSIGQISVTIDTTVKHQTVFGWGAGLRRGTQSFYAHNPAIPASIINHVEDLCFNQLHVNIVRALCQATMEPVNDNNDPFSLDTSKLDWSYYDTKTKDIHAIRQAFAVSNGRINYIFSSNNSAPPWQKTNNSITYGGTILPSMYDEFTEYESAYLLGMQNRYHIKINGFSLFNEPGDSAYFETLSSPPSQVKDLIIKMRKRLNSLEQSGSLPHIDIIGPESPIVSAHNPIGVGKNCIYYLDSAQGGIFADTAAVNSVAIMGTHNYFDESNTANWAKLKSASKNKPIWVTEVCSGTPVPFDNSSVNAVIQAKWIHRSFTMADVRAFNMFSFYDTVPPTGSNNGGLIQYNSSSVTVPKRYYGFKQFVNFVRPGYVRVDASSNNNHLFVSSYINPAKDTLIMVAINDTNIILSNVTFYCPNSPFPVIQYATCDSPDYSTTQLGNISAPASGNFVANMQAMSIKTFIIPLNKTATGISSVFKEANQLEIFPNPASDNFIISLPENDNYDITVYDYTGRKIMQNQKETGKVNIECKQFASGLYYVQAKSKAVVLTGKIMKQ